MLYWYRHQPSWRLPPRRRCGNYDRLAAEDEARRRSAIRIAPRYLAVGLAIREVLGMMLNAQNALCGKW
jgi:hypothetical protein